MTDTSLHYVPVARHFSDILHGVTDEQWTLPTPCSDWTVRDLVVHVVETQRRVFAMAGTEVTTEQAPVEDDVIAAWQDATDQIQGAIADPATASITVGGMAGEQRFDSLVDGLLSIDTLCHTWDLARATGQDETLDPDAVAAAHEKLRAVDTKLRVPGGFKEALSAHPDADAQTKFLSFTGRAV